MSVTWLMPSHATIFVRGNQSKPTPSTRLMKLVTGLFVCLPIGCCGNGFRWPCGISKHNDTWVDLDYTHASQMGGLFPRFPSAIGYESRSKATDTSPRRFDFSQHMCSRCYTHSALKLYVMRETHVVLPLPSA